MKKKATIIGVILLTITILVSCHQKTTDIKISDLVTVCDYTEALERGLDEVIAIRGNKKYRDLSDLDKIKVDDIQKKIKKIAKAAEKKFTRVEAEECPNYEIMKEKKKKIY